MRDRRSVDDLTIEELEQILRIRKRQARLERLQRFESVGRRRGDVPTPADGPSSSPDDHDGAQAIPYESFVYSPTGARQELRDRLLLAIELLAAVGLVAVLILAVISLRHINREAAATQAEEVAALPTPSPTPLITAVVLPGGHTPPTAPGGARPNYEEVPSQLRPLVEQQFAGPALIPTASPSTAVVIRIPAIDVDAPIVQGDGWEQLIKGVGQHIGSANPGEPGNLVLSAHNDIHGQIFRHLDLLEEGDEIIIETTTRRFVYRVVDKRIVPPTAVEVMEPTREPIVTLISCYPYLVNSDRIVVIGELSE